VSSLQDQITSEINASIAVKQALLADAALVAQIEHVALTCLQALRQGGKILFAGNGGSFADAQHLSAEFVSRFMFDRAPLPSVALGTNNSAISAIGNDYGYEQVFARELEALARPGDVFIGISTSGNSPNIIAAAEKAREIDVTALCLTGSTGGKLATLCECVRMPSTVTARIQECHIMVGHIICGLVETSYFKS
jgi:D-sedoheptulose 7-phosphate isomerase